MKKKKSDEVKRDNNQNRRRHERNHPIVYIADSPWYLHDTLLRTINSPPRSLTPHAPCISSPTTASYRPCSGSTSIAAALLPRPHPHPRRTRRHPLPPDPRQPPLWHPLPRSLPSHHFHRLRHPPPPSPRPSPSLHRRAVSAVSAIVAALSPPSCRPCRRCRRRHSPAMSCAMCTVTTARFDGLGRGAAWSSAWGNWVLAWSRDAPSV